MNYQQGVDATTQTDVSDLGITTLFPDSSVLINYSTGPGSPFIHLMGEVVDIKSPYYASTLPFAATSPYTVDSIAVYYGYTRKHTAPTDAADTLLIYTFSNATAANLVGPYYYPNQSANYNTDTVYFRLPKYTYTTNKPNAVGMTVTKMILTNDDTTGTSPTGGIFLTEKAASIGFNVPANKLLGSFIVFKPGYSYVAGQNIEDNDNVFYTTFFEEAGIYLSELFPNS